MSEFNFDSLKREIEERNKETLIKEEAMGKSCIRKTDRNTFLINLLNSVKVGDPNNQSVQAIKAVTESTDVVHGNSNVIAGNQQTHLNIPSQQQQFHNPQQGYQNHQGGFEDRSEGYFREQERIALERLSNSIPKPPSQNNVPMSQMLTEYNKTPYVGQPNNYGGGINAQLLNEHISKTMNEILNSAMADKLVEGMTKNILSEVYARERVEKVVKALIDDGTFRKMLIEGLVENDKYRSIVISTVREIAERKKNNTQK